MYAYICINILWVAGDEFSPFSLAPSPEPAWPGVSSWDLLLWDMKLQHKMRTLFFSSVPSIERPPIAAHPRCSEERRRWEQGKGKEKMETCFQHLLSLRLEHGSTKGASSQPLPEEKEQGQARLFIVNCCGYHEITTQFTAPHFNLI